MTLEERLIQTAKSVAQLRRVYEIADRTLNKQWCKKNDAVAAAEKKHATLCEIARKGKSAAYDHLHMAMKEYDEALVAVHLAAVEVQP